MSFNSFHAGDLGIIGPDGDPREELSRLGFFMLQECTAFGVPRIDEFHPRGMTAVAAAIAVIRHLRAELERHAAGKGRYPWAPLRRGGSAPS